MRRIIDRFVYGVVAVGAVLCVLAFNHNQHEQPSTSDGFFVPTSKKGIHQWQSFCP